MNCLRSFVSVKARGWYSIERLLALHEYSERTSWVRVVAVLIFIPLLPLCLVAAYEAPYLQPPDAGWRANWVVFVVRLGCGMLIGSDAASFTLRFLVPEFCESISRPKRIAFAMFSSAIYAGFAVLLAVKWGFPIPFLPCIANPIAGLANQLATYLVVRHVVHKHESLQRRLLLFFRHATVCKGVAVVYPAYLALFYSVGNKYPRLQPGVTLLVPLIKHVLRRIVTRALVEWEEPTPVLVTFTIDFFHSLYQVTCLQSGSTAWTAVLIICADVLSASRNPYALRANSRVLRHLLTRTATFRLLSTVIDVCDELVDSKQRLTERQRSQLKPIKAFGTLPSPSLSPNGPKKPMRLSGSGIFTTNPRKELRRRATTFRSANLSSIVPISPGSNQILARVMGPTRKATLSHEDESIVVAETSILLYRSEFLLLREYLECIVPLLYGINLATLWKSPNAVYYPQTRATGSESDLQYALLRISSLLMLEVVSFVVLSVSLWRGMRFSPLHQLAYVLESHAVVIQANMILFLLMNASFNIDRSGEGLCELRAALSADDVLLWWRHGFLVHVCVACL